MDTNIDFKNIWKQQTSQKPNLEELLKRLRKFKSENIRKLIIANILLIATCFAIGFIWYQYQPQLITTKIGIVFVLVAMIVFLLAYNKMFITLYTVDNTQSNNEYLRNLYLIQQKQKFMQTTMLNIYFIMLLAGICLYIYEYTAKMQMIYGLLAYTLTFAWIGFNWFYIRPRTIKKQQAKLDDLINKFEELNNQLKEL